VEGVAPADGSSGCVDGALSYLGACGYG
jgi:hypothetical protein